MSAQKVIKGKRTVLIFKTDEELFEYISDQWKSISDNAIKHNGKFCVALSGGKTPVALYQRLAQSSSDFQWAKTHILLTDERFVSRESSDSNYRMVKENILDSVDVPEENLHFFPIKETVQVSAQDFEEELKSFFEVNMGGVPGLDLAILGVGEDGHTASLFPEDDAILEQERLVRSVKQDKLKNERLTLTLPVINNSQNIFFLVTGENKAQVMKKILDENAEFPAAKVDSRQGEVFFLLDTKAASLLDI